MSKEARTLIALAGALCLIFGIFAPFASAPIVGSISLLHYNSIVGWLLLVVAILGGYFATRAAFQYVLYAGIAGVGGLAFAVIWFEMNLSNMRSQVGSQLANNPFSGLAAAFMQNIQLSWGVALLGVGAAALVIASVVKDPGVNPSVAATVDFRMMRYLIAGVAAIAVVVIGYNLLGSLFLGRSVITSANQTQIEERVASSSMSEADKASFSAAIARSDYDTNGKTVDQVIADQRAFEVAQKQEQERAAQLAAEEKAKREVTLRSMLASLTVGIVSKSFQAANFENGTYQDAITMTFAFKNTSSKDIRAFKGVVVYKTLMGDLITQMNLERDQVISAGHSATWDAQTDYNQFMDKDVKLRNTDLKNLKIEWQPQSILFTDGTKLEVTDTSSASE